MPSEAPGVPRIVVLISANAEWAPTMAARKPAASELQRSPYGEYFVQTIGGEPVVFFHGGWGKIAAAASTEYVIERWKPALLINLGTCGGMAGRAQRHELLLVTRTIVYDIQEAMGDSAEAIQAFTTDLDLTWLGPALPMEARRAVLVSGDRDLVPAALADVAGRYDQAVAADWESGAIAWVAAKRGTRLLIVRGVSDLVSATAGDATGNSAAFEQGAKMVMNRLLDRLPDAIAYLAVRLPAATP